MKQLPRTANPAVIRTDYENQTAWLAICAILRAPVYLGTYAFYANLDIVEDSDYRDLTDQELVTMGSDEYDHSFFMIVDKTAITNPDFPILVVDLHEPRGCSFRAIPSAVQGIENNLSVANMGFEEFANAVDADGIFRNFSQP